MNTFGDQGLRKRARLTRRADFAQVYGARIRAGDGILTVFVRCNGLSWSRLGISVHKRTGNAVRRNYIRRRIREAYRRQKDNLPVGLDIVCVAKANAGDRKVDVAASLRALIGKAIRRLPRRAAGPEGAA